MPLRPSTKKFGELALDVKRTFGDESGVQLESGDLLRWANEGQMEIVAQNKVLKARSSIVTTIGQGEYTFPDEHIQQVESIHYDNSPIQPVPFAEAEAQIMTADPEQTEQGTPVLWYEWAGNFTLWPRPDAELPLTLYYTMYPAHLTGDLDELLSVPDKLYSALKDFILAKCYEMDESFDASQLADQRFRQALEMQGEEERQSANMTFPVIQEVW